jgi:hypothetical protein
MKHTVIDGHHSRTVDIENSFTRTEIRLIWWIKDTGFCAALVTRHGNMSLQDDITPEKARELANALTQFADEVEQELSATGLPLV